MFVFLVLHETIWNMQIRILQQSNRIWVDSHPIKRFNRDSNPVRSLKLPSITSWSVCVGCVVLSSVSCLYCVIQYDSVRHHLFIPPAGRPLSTIWVIWYFVEPPAGGARTGQHQLVYRLQNPEPWVSTRKHGTNTKWLVQLGWAG